MHKVIRNAVADPVHSEIMARQCVFRVKLGIFCPALTPTCVLQIPDDGSGFQMIPNDSSRQALQNDVP